MLNSETILNRTNNGLDFFKFVIADLQVQGIKCKNVKNPFYNDTKASLSIFYKDNIWNFKDHGDERFKGNVFNFAAFYYKLDIHVDFNEILENINRDLNLYITDHENNTKIFSKIEKQLYYIFQYNKSKAIEYQKNRGITKHQNFYQSNSYQNFPEAVVFINHNKSGFERRFIATEEELTKMDLPKTQFCGTKENSLFVSGYDKNKDSVFICEGCNNALSFVELGFSAIATFGATNLPSAILLKKFVENKLVILAGDGDKAGEKFNDEIAKLIIENQIDVKEINIIQFPYKKDANDLLIENSLSDFINNSENYKKFAKSIVSDNNNSIENTKKENNMVRQYAEGIFINGKNGWYPISNFSITPKYLIKDLNNDVYWIIELNRINENPKYVTLKNDDWSSAGRLKKSLIKEQFVFKGNDRELTLFQEYMGKTDFAKKIDILGFNDESEAYFFSNCCIINGNKHFPDDFGIVKINEKCFYMPYIK